LTVWPRGTACVSSIPFLSEHLTKRVELSKQFIKKVNRGGIRFLDRIITTDESWFHYYDPETKLTSCLISGKSSNLCPRRNDLMYGNTAELTVWPRGTACVSSIPFLSIKRMFLLIFKLTEIRLFKHVL
jgi:hypothetical protein